MKRYLIFFLLPLLHRSSEAQTLVTGRILEEKDKKPIDSVMITKSNGNIIFSNYLGYFQLQTPQNEQLILKKEGYFDVTFEVPKQTGFKVFLKRTQLDTPEYYYGNTEFFKFIADNLRYPEVAHKAKISGRIYCTFQIDTIGNIQNISFLNQLGGGIEEEIENVISQTPYLWIPSDSAFEFTLPVTFDLIGRRRNDYQFELDETHRVILPGIMVTR